MSRLIDPPMLAAKLRQVLGLEALSFDSTRLISESVFGNGIQSELNLSGIPATYLRPKTQNGQFPAIVYCHAHGGNYQLGRCELCEGASFLISAYFKDLLDLGYAVICIDMPGFGDRTTEGSESSLVKSGIWQGRPLFGRMIEEQIAAVHWLAARPEINEDQIVALGMSMGGALSMWTAALDQRVHAVVQMCMLADVQPMIESGAHDGHGHYLTVPGFLEIADMGDVAGLIAPRRQFVTHGSTDHLTPETARLSAIASARSAYKEIGGELETFLAEGSGHVETPDMRKAVLEFLKEIAACGDTHVAHERTMH